MCMWWCTFFTGSSEAPPCPSPLVYSRTSNWNYISLTLVNRENTLLPAPLAGNLWSRQNRARHGVRGKSPSLELWPTYLLSWETIMMLKMKQTMQCWQLCSWERDKGFEKVLKYFPKGSLCPWQKRQKCGNSGGSTLELGNYSSPLHSSAWKGRMTIWFHFSKSPSMQSLCLFVVPFSAAEEMLLNVHVCPTLIYFKGFKFYAQHLLCVKSLSSDNSRILCKYFYCNSGGHSIGSIQKDAAHWAGAMGRVEFSPPHASPGCALPSFLLPCLLGAALCCWVKRKLQLYYGGQQCGGTVEKHLSPWINSEMWFF